MRSNLNSIFSNYLFMHEFFQKVITTSGPYAIIKACGITLKDIA